MPVIDMTDLPAVLQPGATLAGIDLGTKTIGLAVSDAGLSFAHPRPVIARRKFTLDAQALLAAVEKEKAAAIVVGLPVNMDGSEGPRAQATRAFVRNMERLTALPFVYWDERLSTVAAERALIFSIYGFRKRREIAAWWAGLSAPAPQAGRAPPAE